MANPTPTKSNPEAQSAVGPLSAASTTTAVSSSISTPTSASIITPLSADPVVTAPISAAISIPSCLVNTSASSTAVTVSAPSSTISTATTQSDLTTTSAPVTATPGTSIVKITPALTPIVTSVAIVTASPKITTAPTTVTTATTATTTTTTILTVPSTAQTTPTTTNSTTISSPTTTPKLTTVTPTTATTIAPTATKGSTTMATTTATPKLTTVTPTTASTIGPKTIPTTVTTSLTTSTIPPAQATTTSSSSTTHILVTSKPSLRGIPTSSSIVYTEAQMPIGSPHLMVTPKTTTATAVIATSSAVTSTPSVSIITTGNHQILANIKTSLPTHQQIPHPQSLQAQTPIGLASASQVSLQQLQHQSPSTVVASSASSSTSITLSNTSGVANDSSGKSNNIKTATNVTAAHLPKTFSAVIQPHQQHKQSNPQTVLISLTTKSNATTLQQIQQLQTSLSHPAQHSSATTLNSSMPQTYSVYAQQQNQPQNPAQVVQLVTNQQQQVQTQQPQQQTKAQSFKYICCLQENGVRCERPAGNASFSRRVQKTVSLRKLNHTLDPDVRHAYICEYHKTVIQSARKSPANTREINSVNTAPAAANRTNYTEVPINSKQQTVGLLSHQLNNHVATVASNSPSVRAAAAVGYSHYPGPSLGPIDTLPPSLDNGDNESTSSAMDVDLYQLQVNTLRRYKRHFRVQTRPGLNKLQLADSLKRHFKTMPIIEKEAITYFVYIVKCKKNKLDYNLKNSNTSSQMSNDD